MRAACRLVATRQGAAYRRWNSERIRRARAAHAQEPRRTPHRVVAVATRVGGRRRRIERVGKLRQAETEGKGACALAP